MFVYRNPTKAQRAGISKQHKSFDWKPFGPASDKVGGLALVEEHHNSYCDDAKQNAFYNTILDAPAPAQPEPGPRGSPRCPTTLYIRGQAALAQHCAEVVRAVGPGRQLTRPHYRSGLALRRGATLI